MDTTGLFIEAMLKGAAALLGAWAVAGLLRRRSAAVRHLVMALAVLVLLALPVLVVVGPEFRVAVLPPDRPPATTAEIAMPVTWPAPSLDAAPIAGIPVVAIEPDPRPAGASPAPASVVPVAETSAAFPWTWVLWIAGVSLFLAPLILGAFAVARLRRRARPLDRDDLVLDCATRIGLGACPKVLIAPGATAPMACGILRPVVLLPEGAERWTDSKLRVVLLHEMAHVRRRDVLVHTIARLAAAVHWIDPLAWPLLRRLRIDGEKACDDAVLAAGTNPAEYSSVLLDVARSARHPRFLVAAALPMARGAGFEGRLEAILDGRVSRRGPGAFVRLIALTSTFAVVLALAGIRATSVVAQDGNDASDVIVVAKDGSGAHESIQAAVDAAPAGATIRIGPGVYKERVLVEKPLTLVGAGWEKTRIVAPLEVIHDFRQRSQAVSAGLAAAETPEKKLAVLLDAGWKAFPRPTLGFRGAKGVTVRGLRVDLEGTHVSGVSMLGFAITILASEVKLEGCAVIGSPASGIGVGDASDVDIDRSLVAAVWSTGISVRSFAIPPKVRIRNCDIRNGHHRGITIGPGCDDVLIEGCRISGSYWHGIRYDGCGPTIRGNRIFENARFGIYASGGTSGRIEGNLFVDHGMAGVSCWLKGTDRIVGNTFASNDRSGLEILGATTPIVTKNVFSGNPTGVALNRIGGNSPQAKSPGTAHLVDNVFWRNEKDATKPGEDEVVPYELTADSGNRVMKPGYVDGSKGDYTLAEGSAALKAGAGVAAPLTAASPFPRQPEEEEMDAERAPDKPRVAAPTPPGKSPYEISKPWLEAIMQIKSREKREDAVVWMRGALGSPGPVLQHAGLLVFTQSGEVKYDRTGFRDLILPLTTKLSGRAQVSAFYALKATGLRDGDLDLLLDACEKPSPELRGSASHLIHMYAKGNVEGRAAKVVLKLLDTKNRRVIKEVLRGLWGALTTPAIQNRMVELLETAGSWDDRHSVIYFGLSTCNNKSEPVIRALIDVLGDSNPNDWERALWGLGWGVPAEHQGLVADGFLAMFEARSTPHIQTRCLDGIGKYGGKTHLETLSKLEGIDRLPDAVKSSLERAKSAIRARTED